MKLSQAKTTSTKMTSTGDYSLALELCESTDFDANDNELYVFEDGSSLDMSLQPVMLSSTDNQTITLSTLKSLITTVCLNSGLSFLNVNKIEVEVAEIAEDIMDHANHYKFNDINSLSETINDYIQEVESNYAEHNDMGSPLSNHEDDELLSFDEIIASRNNITSYI